MDYQTDGSLNRGGLILTDKDEFCECIRLYEKAMYSLAFSIVRNESDAGEVISEAIYRAYKNLNSLKYKSSFRPWILKIVHNAAVEMIRKNSKLISMEEIEAPADDGAENDENPDLPTDPADAVESLKQPYRTVVVMFYYENLSVSEIAQITGTNVVAVRQRLSRARKILRESLKEVFGR